MYSHLSIVIKDVFLIGYYIVKPPLWFVIPPGVSEMKVGTINVDTLNVGYDMHRKKGEVFTPPPILLYATTKPTPGPSFESCIW